MAIYHLSMKVISRGKGQSAVASASYRSGEELVDEQTGEIKFYSRSVMPENHILAPSNSPDWVTNRQRLWNEVENSESRINSRLARELQIALPLELSNEEQTNLIKNFIQKNCVDLGMVADIAIHRDHAENPHAHVMLTTREISENGFEKKNRNWDKKEYLADVRKNWAVEVNHELARIGSKERIDHRSYEERGLELIPTKHVGVKANQLSAEGVSIEVIKKNEEIKAYNKKIIDLQERKEQLMREKYLAERLENKTAEKSSINKADMIVPNSFYLNNQRKIALTLKEKNQLEAQIRKVNNTNHSETMHDLKSRELNAKLRRVQEKLNQLIQNRSDFVSHAKTFLEQNAEDVLVLSENIRTTFKGKEGEIYVRFANKINELQTTDFITLVNGVEKDLVFNSVKKIVGHVPDYQSIVKTLNSKNSELQSLTKNSEEYLSKVNKLSTSVAYLERAKSFYESQAVSSLMNNEKYKELVERYWTSDNNDRSHLIKLHENSLRYKDVSATRLEQITGNDEKLNAAKRLVRGELTYFNVEYKLNNTKKWENSLTNKLSKLQVSETAGTKEKLTNDLRLAKENQQTLKEAMRVLEARMTDKLTERPQLFEQIKKINQGVGVDTAVKVNAELYDRIDTMDDKEAFISVQDNITKYVETETITTAYKQFGKLANDREGLRDRYAKLENSVPFETYEQARKEKANLHSTEQVLESVWKDKARIEPKRFKSSDDKATLKEAYAFLESNKLTAKTLSGSMKQLEYYKSSAQRTIDRYDKIQNVELPLIKKTLAVQENQAFRYLEKALKIDGLATFKSKLSDPQKEALISFYDYQKSVGKLNEPLKLKDLDQEFVHLFERQQRIDKELSTLSDLRKSLNVAEQKKDVEFGRAGRQSDSIGQELSNIHSAKEVLSDRRKESKSVKEVKNSRIETIKEKEQDLYKQRRTVSKGLAVTSKLGQLMKSIESNVSDGQKDRERRKRLRSIQAEKGNSNELQMELDK